MTKVFRYQIKTPKQLAVGEDIILVCIAGPTQPIAMGWGPHIASLGKASLKKNGKIGEKFPKGGGGGGGPPFGWTPHLGGPPPPPKKVKTPKNHKKIIKNIELRF